MAATRDDVKAGGAQDVGRKLGERDEDGIGVGLAGAVPVRMCR